MKLNIFTALKLSFLLVIEHEENTCWISTLHTENNHIETSLNAI